MSTEEGEALARAHGAGFCEVSSKTRENVRKPFVDLVDRIVKTPGLLGAAAGKTAGTVTLSGAADDDETGYFPGCSC